MKRGLSFATLCLLGLPGPSFGFAYTTVAADGTFKQNVAAGEPVVWRNPNQSVTLNFSNEPRFNTAAQAALDEWTAVNTALQYQRGAAVAQTCASGDGANSAGWGTVTCDGKPFGDALAITKRSYTRIGGVWYLQEADIVVDQSRPWSVYNGPQKASVDFKRVILHELGHVLGLDHPDQAGQQVEAIMNSHTSNVESLQDDDLQGLSYLYGPGPGPGTSNSSAAQSGGSASGGGGADILLVGLAWLGRRMRRAGRRVQRNAEADRVARA